MRLLHTSDWHLGRSLLGISLLEDQQAFGDQLIELTHDFRPDLVIILGDLFERSNPSEEALHLLDHILQRLLLDCKVRVLMAPGQHDGVSRLNFGSWLYERRQLQLVTNIEQALSPIMLEDADGPAHINVIPYLRVHEVDQHFRSEKVPTPGHAGDVVLEHLTRFRRLRRRAVRGVVAGYLWVEGGQPCGEERPFEGELDSTVNPKSFEGINYAALGYLHQHQKLGKEGNLCYSGSPFAFHFESTPQPRGVVKMEMDSQGYCQSELVPLHPKRHFYRFGDSLERLLLGPQQALDPQDIVVLELSQDSDLLSADLIQRLRSLYPNLWRIERPEVQQQLKTLQQLDPVRNFQQFYQTVQGESLDDEARLLLADLFSEVEP
ncbi:exonuclease subunit SbcD [bacterium]|nr:exonuclease subunit SbcD [bacterium]